MPIGTFIFDCPEVHGKSSGIGNMRGEDARRPKYFATMSLREFLKCKIPVFYFCEGKVQGRSVTQSIQFIAVISNIDVIVPGVRIIVN